jgi:hypothetical protein
LQPWPPTDHYESLLKEACPNQTYHVKQNLKDCDMMKNFMTLGYLTRDKENIGDLGRKGVMPFLREEAVMTVYDGHPLL